jgi:spermidine synthase
MSAKRDRLLLLAFLLSGCAGLGYEILWTRLLALSLGSEILAVLGVMSGFFGGLALGAWWLQPWIRRARDPLRLFASLEVTAGAWALLSPFLLHRLAATLPLLLGPAAGENDTFGALALSVGIAALALLPATLCMGATLPALVEARARLFANEPGDRALGRLYAANTAGAVGGVWLTVYVLLPRGGMVWGAAMLAGISLTAALLAWRWGRQQGAKSSGSWSDGPSFDTGHRSASRAPTRLALLVFLTGLAGVGLELVCVQTLAQVTRGTIYTFANTLAVYLIGTTAGAWLWSAAGQRLPRSIRSHASAHLARLLLIATLLAAFALHVAPALFARSGASAYSLQLLAEIAVTALVFLPATMLMGALFSHLLGFRNATGVGRLLALNTAGAALAPFLFGLWVIPAFGYRAALLAVATCYALLLLLTAESRVTAVRRVGQIAFVAVIALVTLPDNLRLARLPEGWTLLSHHQGLYGTLLVGEKRGERGEVVTRRLQVNQYFRMGGGYSYGEHRMGHLPFLLAPDARRALFLGVGTGATLSACRAYPLEHVDAVELVPEVISALPLFADINHEIADDPRITFHAADARRFVSASRERYDVIVGDLFHPARDGAGNLYSLEHFRTIRGHLTPRGLFIQWLPLHQFDQRNLATVIRTFLAVFPRSHAFLGVYNPQTSALGLVGQAGPPGAPPLTLDLRWIANALARGADEAYLGAVDLLGAYCLDRAALEAFAAGEEALNTDLRPRILCDAPRSAYLDSGALAHSTLRALLEHRVTCPDQFLEGAPARERPAFRAAVDAWWGAVDPYLRADIALAEAPPPPPLAAGVVELYLRSYARSPAFPPTRGRLFELPRVVPDAGREIFPRMLEITPDEPRVWQEYLSFLDRAGPPQQFQGTLQRAAARFPHLFRTQPPAGTQ